MSIDSNNDKLMNKTDEQLSAEANAAVQIPPPKTAIAKGEELAADSSAVEKIKDRSDYLRGDIATGLEDELSGGLSEDAQVLIKFHGIYQQDNRDIRAVRASQKLEADYSFMIRLRVPSGMLTAEQWLTVDSVAADLTENGGIRLTTRQTLQFHGAPKENLRSLLQSCAQRLLDSIAACGDVNRNVMCSPHANLSPLHAAAANTAAKISEALLPTSRAYYEIWLGEEKLAAAPEIKEPLYGKHYLPRKFKIAVAVPPANDVDIYSQDIGFIAVGDDEQLHGFNVVIGGGLGMTHGDRATYPRLGDALGFCQPSQAVDVAWHLAAIQRDYGNRSNRKQSRFKYTVARLGMDFITKELTQRLGFSLSPSKPIQFTHRSDMLGWQQQSNGNWSLGLFVANGRLATETPLKQSLREAAALSCCEFLMTPNQNIMLTNIADKNRARIEAVFTRRNLSTDFSDLSGLHKNAMACVAFPTCPLAMAEAERYLPSLVEKLEAELSAHGLQKEAISIRMTGCPNGCARPYLGEIGLVGKSLGRYNLYLGASATGERLSSLVGENYTEANIIATLSPLFAEYAKQRQAAESFGDFLIRSGTAKIPTNAADFHP